MEKALHIACQTRGKTFFRKVVLHGTRACIRPESEFRESFVSGLGLHEPLTELA